MSWLAIYAVVIGTVALVLQALRTYWNWRDRRYPQAWHHFDPPHDMLDVSGLYQQLSGGQPVGTCRPGCIDNCPGGSQSDTDLPSTDDGK